MTRLSDLDGTKWVGRCELWLDPLGDDVEKSDCTCAIDGNVVSYTWEREGKTHHGSITLHGVYERGSDAPAAGEASFVDSWHSPETMHCRAVADAWGLFQVQGEYGEKRDWRWRIGLSLRQPSGQLVLQMTNVTTWGEEVRAVRMTFERAPSA